MRDIKRANDLLTLAEADLDAFDVLSESGRIHDRTLGFHAQQAVEKTLKAWLSLLGVDFPFTHDLDALLSLLEDSSALVAGQFRDLEVLTPFAVQFRYSARDDCEDGLDWGEVRTRVSVLLAYVKSLADGLGNN